MRISEITVERFYAVRANLAARGQYMGEGRIQDVHDGEIAIPVKVERIGKFRWRREGACEAVIAEDHFRTTVIVRFPDFAAMYPDDIGKPQNKRNRSHSGYRRHSWDTAAPQWPGYPEGVKLTSRKMLWGRERILETTDIVMPWETFLMRREERIMAETDMTAYRARRAVLHAELEALVAPFLDAAPHTPGASIRWEHPDHILKPVSLDQEGIIVTRMYDAKVPVAELPDEVQEEMRRLVAEIGVLDKKMQCAA